MVYQYQPINPLQSFTQGIQVLEGLRGLQQQRQQEQLAQQQAEQQQMTQAAFAQDVQAWQMNPSREGWAQLQFKYPQLAERAKPLAEMYGEQGKSAIISVGTQFLTAQGEERAAVLDQAIVAAENSRLPEVKALFTEARDLYKTDPARAEAAVRTALIQEDGDLYEKMFDKSSLYDTATIKELIAEGLEYGTPEFQQALKDKREGDPWVAVPGVGLFMRDQLEAAAAGGQTQAMPSIPEGAVKMLIQNPKLRGDFDKKYGAGAADRVLGGGGSNVTGSFRGD